MMFFEQIDMPKFDALEEYERLIENKTISFHKQSLLRDQICLTTTSDKPDDIYYGNGSLVKDFNNKTSHQDEYGNWIETIPLREVPLREEDFTQLCTRFEGTLFESLYNELTKRYHLGRIRFMKSQPKTCLSWHMDSTDRIHYPLVTSRGCQMVIRDEVKFLPADTCWYTRTKGNMHTAFNSSGTGRVHLVACVLGEK